MYKGNFIPCLCTLFFPFSSVGCCKRCGKAYSTRQEKYFRLKARCKRSSWLWHLGNCVAFTLPFSTCRCKMGTSSFIIFLSIFKEIEFCHLFYVGCSLMFYLSWTEKVIKKLQSELDLSSHLILCNVERCT